MKAWQFASFGLAHLQAGELPRPTPRAGEVQVKIHAVSLNYRDLLLVRGKYNPRLALPSIPCSDCAGEITATGEGVRSVQVGQRVAAIFMQEWLDGEPTPERCRGALGGDAPGVLAEYAVFKEQGVVAIPSHLSYEQASTLPCAGVTAWNAVMHAAQLHPGDFVVILGTGGVSIFALQFATLLGATVLGTSSSDEKLARARSLGLHAGVNYRNNPDWAKWVLEQTNKQGAHLIVEVGGVGTLNQSIRAARMGGVIAQIGVLGDSLPNSDEPLPVSRILHRQLQIKGIYVGSRARFKEMNDAMEKSFLVPVVDRIYSFDDARQAFAAMEAGSHFGKIVIRVAA